MTWTTEPHPTRCPWAGNDPIYVAYHDEEWGVPNGDDQTLFGKLLLEGFQAGLSWITILKKRKRFVEVFDNFDAEKIARYGPEKVEALMSDAGIVRNRLKINAAISSAQAYLDIHNSGKTFGAVIWDFVDGKPIENNFTTMDEIPAQTDVSIAMSKSLKKQGFRFCGPTITYAFMQSMGLTNDHLTECHQHRKCARLASAFKAPENT